MRYLVIILIAGYLLNSPILKLVYPKVSEDYYQYIAFVSARNIFYEGMFLLFSLVIFRATHGITKSLITFLMVLVGGSFVDKAIFKITWYLYSDILLVGVAILTAYLVYARNK